MKPILIPCRLNLDRRIADNAEWFPNIATWTTAFGPGGIAGAYKGYMDNTVLPQINTPPTDLTELWRDMIKPGIAAAENLPDVKTDSKNSASPGPFYPDWKKFSDFANEVDAIYQIEGGYEWDYTFNFEWNRNNKQ